MIDFPASPTVGQQFTAAGVTWTWDGAKWLPSGLSPTVVPGIRENRIINGDMRIDQRNGGASGAAFDYTVDRWAFYAAVTAGKGTWQRVASGGGLPQFPYCLQFTSNSNYTSAAGDVFTFMQPVEADMISDFAWGTPSAQPVTLSFWAFSSKAGTFGGAVQNFPGQTRSYPFSFSIPTANVWAKVVLTIPGDTAGAWVMSGNGASLALGFDFGSGATYRGPANAWASANYIGVNGGQNILATSGATFAVTGVKLEIGSVATPFNRQSLAKSMADCQRYYCNLANISVSAGPPAAGAGEQTYNFVTLPTTMRAAPTISVPTISSTNCSAAGALDQAPTGFSLYITALAAGVFFGTLGAITASAEL